MAWRSWSVTTHFNYFYFNLLDNSVGGSCTLAKHTKLCMVWQPNIRNMLWAFGRGASPRTPTRGSVPGTRWGTSTPQTSCAPTSKSWLRVCCLSAESASIAVDSAETRPGDDDDDDNDVCVCVCVCSWLRSVEDCRLRATDANCLRNTRILLSVHPLNNLLTCLFSLHSRIFY